MSNKVLIIDDDCDFVEAISSYLRQRVMRLFLLRKEKPGFFRLKSSCLG